MSGARTSRVGALVLGVALGCGSDDGPTNAATDATTAGDTGTATDPTTTTDAPGETDPADSGASDTASSGSSTGAPEGNPLFADRTLNIAHRGGAALRPEETLLAFDHAIAIGADVLELDVHATADGVIVCMHDDTVDRTTDGSGALSRMTFDALQRLDAGYRFSSDGGATFPYRGQGVTVPALTEVFSAHPDAYYAIEIKPNAPELAAVVLALIDDAGLHEHAILASFHDAVVAEVRTLDPQAMTSLALVEYAEFIEQGDTPRYSPPAQFIQAPFAGVTVDVLATAQAHGLFVHAWTVNEAGPMQTLIDRGVHGIMTDDPELLASLLP